MCISRLFDWGLWIPQYMLRVSSQCSLRTDVRKCFLNVAWLRWVLRFVNASTHFMSWSSEYERDLRFVNKPGPQDMSYELYRVKFCECLEAVHELCGWSYYFFTKMETLPNCYSGHIDACLNEYGTFAKNLRIYLKHSYFVFGWFTRRVKILNSFPPFRWQILMG